MEEKGTYTVTKRGPGRPTKFDAAMPNVNVRLPKALIDRTMAYANMIGADRSVIIRQALEKYLGPETGG